MVMSTEEWLARELSKAPGLSEAKRQEHHRRWKELAAEREAAEAEAAKRRRPRKSRTKVA